MGKLNQPYYQLVVGLIVLVSVFQVHAQDQENHRFNANFTKVPFTQFVEQLEQQSNYHFYFNPEWVDSLTVTVHLNNRTLDEILNEVLNETELKYAITRYHEVFITLRTPINSQLPDGFFDYAILPDSNKRRSYTRLEEVEKSVKEKTIVIGSKGFSSKPTASIAGYIRNQKTGEPIIGATMMIDQPLIGTATDASGYYSITLPKGNQLLKIRSIGMKSREISVILQGDGKLNVEIEEDVVPLREVVIQSERDERVMGLQMGTEKLDLRTMKQLPLALGEVDVIKAVLTLPGVQSVGEGSAGFNVRGGATDQNLIMFNEAIIYNPSHLFGFFSAFNPDLLKNVELYKSGIPAEYGGRISSVMDISTREGNKKKFSGSGGISPVTGRLALEGPIVKEKGSFLIGARSTYSDWLLKKIPSDQIRNSDASFYDVNLHLNQEISNKDFIHLSGYLSSDRFKLQNDTSYQYSNKMAALKWRHIFTNHLFGELSGNYSGYDYSIQSDHNPANAFELSYDLKQYNVKADFNYFLAPKHTINFGAGAISYQLYPGSLLPKGDQSLIVPDVLQREQAVENAIYIGDQFEWSNRLSLYGGIRYSFFKNKGPRDVYVYEPDLPKDVTSIIDTVSYATGKTIANYGGPEVRFSARYVISTNSSVKLSYNRLRQYLQMLSNTTAISPTDIWKLSDQYIKPLIGNQVSLGYYQNTPSLEISTEVYYKQMENFLDYKGGAELILNHHLETDVINARGKAYGAEIMIKKPKGKLNGWLSYTYSRSLLRTRGQFDSEIINHGNYYPSNYDKPHAVNLISNYRFNHRFSMSGNVVYSTGRPITLPLAKYSIDGSSRLYYSDRNAYRIPDYFRIDVGINIEGNHKIKKLAHSSWNISVYNLTGRKNAYSVYFTSENGVVKSYKLSVFGNPIPTITYNFRF